MIARIFEFAVLFLVVFFLIPRVNDMVRSCAEEDRQRLARQEEELNRLRLIEAAHKRVLLQTAKILAQLEEARKQKGE